MNSVEIEKKIRELVGHITVPLKWTDRSLNELKDSPLCGILESNGLDSVTLQSN